jgi:hypothetical protein
MQDKVLCEQLEVKETAVIGKEYDLAIVIALGGMMDPAGEDQACEPRHHL